MELGRLFSYISYIPLSRDQLSGKHENSSLLENVVSTS